MVEGLVRKLESVSALTDYEKQAVRGLFSTSRRVTAGDDVIRDGETPQAASLMLEGLACRYKAMPDGRRQIMAFLIPGDLIDMHGLLMGEMDHSVSALTHCRIAVTQPAKLLEAMEQHPTLARALWRDTLVDGAVAREWLVGLGRRTAYSRIAHLLCEVIERLNAAGLSNGGVWELPLTQQELADSLGLSLVHVNRVLQRLRADGLVTLGRGALQVHDVEGLKQAGGFDPSYLKVKAIA